MAAAAKSSPARPGASSASSFLSIRNKQIECLERMLNFNNPVDSRTSWQEQWKILIYDNFCRDIISTLFKVADLRRHGVTLHLNLHAERQPVQDASALYLFLPTTDNIERIAKDCANGLYDSVHLNIASSIPQSEMHDLATAVVQSESAHRIAKVVDQYMNFVSLNHNLFSLNIPVRSRPEDDAEAAAEWRDAEGEGGRKAALGAGEGGRREARWQQGDASVT